MEESDLICEHCNNPVQEDDEFCPLCGSIFIDNVYCKNHLEVKAEGVCIICCLPFCKYCGGEVNSLFLCNEHDDYEIYEGMARVYGTTDILHVSYVKTILEQSGLHPVLYCRHSPYGGPKFVPSLFEAHGDFRGNIVDEVKLMVPVQEVLKAEELLESILPE